MRLTNDVLEAAGTVFSCGNDVAHFAISDFERGFFALLEGWQR